MRAGLVARARGPRGIVTTGLKNRILVPLAKYCVAYLGVSCARSQVRNISLLPVVSVPLPLPLAPPSSSFSLHPVPHLPSSILFTTSARPFARAHPSPLTSPPLLPPLRAPQRVLRAFAAAGVSPRTRQSWLSSWCVRVNAQWRPSSNSRAGNMEEGAMVLR